jgi:hypothetical protein
MLPQPPCTEHEIDLIEYIRKAGGNPCIGAPGATPSCRLRKLSGNSRSIAAAHAHAEQSGGEMRATAECQRLNGREGRLQCVAGA